MRYSLYPPPLTVIAPPKTYANSSVNINGWMVTSVSFSGIWRMCSRLRRANTNESDKLLALIEMRPFRSGFRTGAQVCW